MAGLRLGGLASGMDTEAIVSQLMAIERQPRGRLERRQAAVQARQDALRDIATKLKSLKTATQGLSSLTTWARTQTVTSADPTKVGVRTAGTVAAGTYDVEVQQLATTASRTFGVQSHPTTSQLKITAISSGTQYSYDIPAGATVDDVVAAINAGATAPVVARNYNGQLLLSAKAPGAGGNFDATGQVLDAETAATTGQDSQFTVNGTAYTRSANTVTDAIAGAELTLSAVTTSPVTITATQAAVDSKAVAAKVKAFVDAYNAAADAARSRMTEKRVANPTTLVDARKGVLFADSGLSNVLTQLRMSVMDPISVGNSETMDEFAEIGVSSGATTGGASTPDSINGRLQFDEAKFLAAYQADPTSVERLLRGADGSPGLAARLDGVLKPFTEADGLFDGRINASGSELSRLTDQLKRMDDRLARKETLLRRQFTALETALSKLNTQSIEISSRLAGLSNDS